VTISLWCNVIPKRRSSRSIFARCVIFTVFLCSNRRTWIGHAIISSFLIRPMQQLDNMTKNFEVPLAFRNTAAASNELQHSPTVTVFYNQTSHQECPSPPSSQPSGPASTQRPDAAAPSTSTRTPLSPSTTGSPAIETRSSREDLSKLLRLAIGLSIGLRRALLRRGGRGVGSVERWLGRRRCLLLKSEL
jgi:hypothetical protein